MHSLCSFEFMIGVILFQRLFHSIAGIAKKLQGRALDMV